MSDRGGHYSRRAFLATAAVNLMAVDYRIIDPNVPARDAAPETLLEKMKANGVPRTVIIQVIHYRYDNSYLASVLKQYPNVFQGVARVDPLNPEAPDHLSKLTE